MLRTPVVAAFSNLRCLSSSRPLVNRHLGAAAGISSACRQLPARSQSNQNLRFASTAGPSLLQIDISEGAEAFHFQRVRNLEQDDKKRNALSSEMMGQLAETLAGFQDNKNVRVAVLRHDGKVFSSGHDLKELHLRQETQGTTDPVFSLCTKLMLTVRKVSFPVIAEIGGLATAGGCQLVASCDLAIASEEASFATPGVAIGLFCTTPGLALSRSMHPKQAMEMLLTGDRIPAHEAVKIGLINKVVPPEQLREHTMKLALKIAAAPSETIQIGKEAFYKHLAIPDLESAYQYAQGVMVDNMGRGDAREGIGAFIEKRQPTWLS